MEEASEQKLEPQIRTEQWMEMFCDTPIFFQIYFLKDSYYIWVGSGTPKLTTVDVACQTKYERVPIASTILGHGLEGVGKGMSTRLAQKTGKMIYLGYGADTSIPRLVEWAEKKILNKILPK